MTPEARIKKVRIDAAYALQKLVFRANQKNGFVTTEDCLEVTDMLTVTVIESFAQYFELVKEENKCCQ